MARYYLSQEKIEEIREAADIIDIISEYIPIKKRGKNFTGLCPFHSEKKPSFTVSPIKQLYHCFGCGASGNIITFVMNYESLSFIEAIEILAKKFGIKLDRKSAQGKDKIRQELLDVNDFAFEFFKKSLMQESGKMAITYLIKRGIDPATRGDFGIGYVPGGWDNLLKAAQKEGISKTILHSAGLLVKNEKGSFYDRFRNRIIFPFYNSIGKKIGFAGRTLEDEVPKYLNISETPLYKKRYTLYGLYQGKEEIRKTDKCLVVEGYMDLLTLYQAGFKNAVAISGTSLTDEQAKFIRKYTRNIYISFDADRSGKDATLRGISIFIKNGLVPFIITLIKGKDPDEIIRKEGREEFQRLIANAEHFVDFKMRFLLSKYDLKKTVEKTKVVKEIRRTLTQVKDLTERQMWLNKISKKLSVDESVLISGGKSAKNKEQFMPSILSLKEMCCDLITLLAMRPEKYEEVVGLFENDNLFDETTKSMMTYIEKKKKEQEKIDVADIIDLIESAEERKRVSATSFNINEENVLKMLNQYIRRIKSVKLKERWDAVKEEIQRKEGDSDAVRVLLQEQKRIAYTLKTLGGNFVKEKRV
ncbi:MAG: DNA primase [Candidatus Cloacimonadota bacterium]|nr:MAG: DNA primase [Candidatus Cloacimonadota bacterium]